MLVQLVRWRPTFSLRCMLLAIFLVAISSAYFGRAVAIYRSESKAIRHLESLGARCSRRVFYSKSTVAQKSASWFGQERFFQRVDHVDFSRAVDTQINDIDIQTLLRFNELRSANLSHTDITDEALAILARLPNINSLNLSGTNVTDACGKSLKRLPNLHHLNLTSTGVTDALLEQIAGLDKLRSIRTRDTLITLPALANQFGIETVRDSVQDRFKEMGICGGGGSIPHHHIFWLDSPAKTQMMLDAISALGDDSHFAFSFGLTAGQGTDDVVSALAAYPRVIALHVDSTSVTDAGVSRLKAAGELRYLAIYGAALSAKCVADLVAMEGVETIILPSSAESDADASYESDNRKIENAKAPRSRQFTLTVFQLGRLPRSYLLPPPDRPMPSP